MTPVASNWAKFGSFCGCEGVGRCLYSANRVAEGSDKPVIPMGVNSAIGFSWTRPFINRAGALQPGQWSALPASCSWPISSPVVIRSQWSPPGETPRTALELRRRARRCRALFIWQCRDVVDGKTEVGGDPATCPSGGHDCCGCPSTVWFEMFLSVFDLFKIGIGPSSSHTMGPMTAAGMFLREVRDGEWPRPTGVHVERIAARLHGSLAFTGVGHGSDRAVILGLCGLSPDTVDLDAIDAMIDGVRDTEIHRAGRSSGLSVRSRDGSCPGPGKGHCPDMPTA